MYILITKDEYKLHATLATDITSRTNQTVNGVMCKYGQINNANYAAISGSLAVGSVVVSDGILLPPDAL